MATTGHENEPITVSGLKAALQKLKTDHIDAAVTSSTSGLKIEVVTSMPSSPAANTIYIVK